MHFQAHHCQGYVTKNSGWFFAAVLLTGIAYANRLRAVESTLLQRSGGAISFYPAQCWKRAKKWLVSLKLTRPFLLNPAKVAGKSGIEHHVKEESPRNIKEVEEFRFCLLEIEMRPLQILCLVISRKKLSMIVFDH